ncbi:MAG TPA: 16S rRNA (uracil(1498)-N(3))-methyltransferase [Candidatus Limnocylindria bacterium]|nr:16S rRNA (uracil(1498)-N(3))-methyltransferase [Candidatus Limnocylindria bacterium]
MSSMEVQRFFVTGLKLGHDFWLHDKHLLDRWHDLGLAAGQQVVLFDGVEHDRLYKVAEITRQEAHLLHVTDFERKVPGRTVYLLWSLLEGEENMEVLQKGTELGVSHFLPLLRDNESRTTFDRQHALEILIKAAEHSGRSDIPTIREPMHARTAQAQLTRKVQITTIAAGGESEEAANNQDREGVTEGDLRGDTSAAVAIMVVSRLPPEEGKRPYTAQAIIDLLPKNLYS